ncbi:hypothetical protein NQK81_27835 [Amycolatopsis roodepoortensis]|uniref:hypothetical protein n=1 Tax=Amycolatopsis roodepoortensis TaxID=700274 RepID=UPI00214BD8B9|nr:hypothetical protein [Amycolatopsis roodepoortensis]UUV28588.1 hypothetical protein NQK81_27835 [Amycolatopsis roodepoortensis]
MSSTTHDFYLGRGQDADWLGSVRLGTRNDRWLDEITRARSAGGFITLVALFLRTARIHEAGEVALGNREWPWPWPTSHGTDFTHAFDTDAVWTARRGDRWSLRADQYIPPGPDETPLEFPPMRDSCGCTGIDAADTTARRYGPLLGDTYQHDLPQLGLRILADLTGPPGLGEPAALSGLRAQLPPHLRYAVTADEAPVEVEFEVVGYRDGDLAADTSVHALSMLPALYGWADPSGGPPRFGVRVRIATDERHTTHPVLDDPRARAVLTTY